MTNDQESLLRQYAAGTLAWRTLRKHDFSYSDVLDGLGQLGLRPPVASTDGPNGERLARGISIFRTALESQPRP